MVVVLSIFILLYNHSLSSPLQNSFVLQNLYVVPVKQELLIPHLPWLLVTTILLSIFMNLSTLGSSHKQNHILCHFVTAYVVQRNILELFQVVACVRILAFFMLRYSMTQSFSFFFIPSFDSQDSKPLSLYLSYWSNVLLSLWRFSLCLQSWSIMHESYFKTWISSSYRPQDDCEWSSVGGWCNMGALNSRVLLKTIHFPTQ